MFKDKGGRRWRLAASRRSWGLIAAAGIVTGGTPAAIPLHASPRADPFDTIFTIAGEPAALHYRAEFGGAGPSHVVEVWRDRDRRLKRVTDTAVETYAAHKPGGANFNMLVVDHRKRIVTEIGRDSLYRLGNFTDWFDLAHGLRHPKGAYRLAAATAPAASPKPVDRCEWYNLVENARATRVCWSVHDRLPLLILASNSSLLWRVTALDRTPFAKDIFRIPDKGYVRINANRDAERD